MTNKVIVFDLDDTLYKEKDFLCSAYKEIADRIERTYSLEQVFPFMMTAWSKRKDVFAMLIAHWNLPIKKDELLDMYRKHKPNIRIEVHIQSLLERLALRYKLGLITDGRSVTQRNKIQALHIGNWIKERNIVISEEFGSEKPSLNNYIYFQHKYPDAQYVYVGDNPAKDFLAPNILGWKTVCLLDNGENIHKQRFDLDTRFLPKYCIKSIESLSDIINNK